MLLPQTKANRAPSPASAEGGSSAVPGAGFETLHSAQSRQHTAERKVCWGSRRHEGQGLDWRAVKSVLSGLAEGQAVDDLSG